jgi:hypothetical protein
MNVQRGLKSTSLRLRLPNPGSDFVHRGGPGIACTRFGRLTSLIVVVTLEFFFVSVCLPSGQGTCVRSRSVN